MNIKMSYEDINFSSIEEAVIWELTPDSYRFRSRKERTALMIANIIERLVDKDIFNATDLNIIFQQIVVKNGE